MDEKLPVENESVFNTVLGIARIVDKYEIQPDRWSLDDVYNITLHYGDIRVTLGPDTLLEEKITRVAAILPKISGKSGVLHLEDYSRDTVNIIFTEDVPEEDTDVRDQEDSPGDASGDDSQSFGEDASVTGKRTPEKTRPVTGKRDPGKTHPVMRKRTPGRCVR